MRRPPSTLVAMAVFRGRVTVSPPIHKDAGGRLAGNLPPVLLVLTAPIRVLAVSSPCPRLSLPARRGYTSGGR